MKRLSADAQTEPINRADWRATMLRLTAAIPLLLVFALGVQSCTFAQVQTVKFDHFNLQRGQPWDFTVMGTGNCTMLRMNWGDTSSNDFPNVDFDANPLGVKFSHVYNGWGGTKTVIAQGVTNCVGTPQTQIRVVPPFKLGFGQPTATACSAVPGVPPLRANTTVHITANPDPFARIDFGCLLGGCVYDAAGEPNSVAPSGYPFPGLRKYSLVVRIGTQVEQGGMDFFFHVNQAGPMEVCVNDDKISDNSGAWGLNIDVNE
jgi:hypothetical protein